MNTLCDVFYMSRSALQHLFHKEFGCGPMEYFSRMKIRRARAMLAGCGSTAADTGAAPAETKATEEKTEAADTEAETGTEEAAATGEGKVYYLNFKPEQADDFGSVFAAEYTAETGVPVTVVTAASGTYESTLKSEMAKTEAPTLFQVDRRWSGFLEGLLL